jgi:tyrosyl-tRNA synthetase
MAALVEDLRFRGLIHQMTDPALEARLDAAPLTAYIGFDPTADSLHVGNLLQLCNLRRLQQAGHRPIVLAGGGTGLIGDPGGKSAERNLLTDEELQANLAGIRGQLEQFLDFSPGAGPSRAELVDNADWLAGIGLFEFLRDVGKHFTVNQMVSKESVRSATCCCRPTTTCTCSTPSTAGCRWGPATSGATSPWESSWCARCASRRSGG